MRLLILVFLLVSCGKSDNSSHGLEPEFILAGLKNENSFFKDGYIYMTSNKYIDSEYHRWRSPFAFKLPLKIPITSSTGVITAKLVFTDATYICEYAFDGTDFVFDFCDGNNGPNFSVGTCIFLKIEGTRNFEITAILEEVSI